MRFLRPSHSLFIVLALTVGVSFPAAAEPVNVVTGNGYAPYADRNLPEGGLATRIVRAAFKAAGREVEISFMPWRRGYRATRAGRYAATFPHVPTPDRRREMYYSDPIIEAEVRAWTLVDSPLRVDELSELTGTLGCLPQSYAPSRSIAEHYASGAIVRVTPRSIQTCFRMLKHGHVDFVETDRYVMRATASAVFRNLDSIRALARVIDEDSLHLIAARAGDGSRALIETFNRGLARLKADGRYSVIMNTYFAR